MPRQIDEPVTVPIPWGDLTNGSAWEVTMEEAVSYSGSFDAFRSTLHSYAYRNGKKVTTRIVNGYKAMRVQFTDKEN